MTPHDFNQKLLLAKETAIDTLEDLCGPAFPRRKGVPSARPDGTPLSWEEKEAIRLAQPPRLDTEEQHILVMERTQRMRAATTILKTRPIGEDGNPLPISRRHPERHTRAAPRQQKPADNTNTPTTSEAPRPEDAGSQPAGGASPAGTTPQRVPRPGGPAAPPFDRVDIVTVSSALPGRTTQHQPGPAEPARESG